MKIALAQMKVVPNRPKKNLETMLRMIDEAKKEKADIVAFPEMCVGGYLLGDEWLDDDFCLGLMEHNQTLQRASKDIALIYGNIYLDKEINARVEDANHHPNKDGRTRRYNAVYAFQNGNPVQRVKETNFLPAGVHPKVLLPNYRFFDDQRYYFSLEDVTKDFGRELVDLVQPFVISIDGEKIPIGLEVCEDLWCEDYRKDGKALNPTKMLIENGAKAIINISASPWTYGKNNARDRRILFLKKESGDVFIPFFYVNCTGVQNNGKNFITFDGGSTVYNADGLPVKFSREAYQEELMIVSESDLQQPSKQRVEKKEIAQKYDALIAGIRHVKEILGLEEDPKFLNGISGGIDSAVTTALLVKAVGKEKVLGMNLSTLYNSEKTKNVARSVARALDIPFIEASIEELVKENQRFLEAIELFGKRKELTEFQKENLQAKIRGTSVLSNFAAMHEALFVSNGNKLEIALGYATLYGDWGGALCIPGSLTKTDMVNLAGYLNEEVFKCKVIPDELIPDRLFRFREDQIQPSAELRENQVDPMKFGYHCALLSALTDYKKKSACEIMRWYLAGKMEEGLGISTELLERWNIDDPEEFVRDLEWFDSNIKRAVFKRVQSPPIIALTKSDYGYDIRESMLPYEPSAEYERLKEKILTMKRYKLKEGENHE